MRNLKAKSMRSFVSQPFFTVNLANVIGAFFGSFFIASLYGCKTFRCFLRVQYGQNSKPQLCGLYTTKYLLFSLFQPIARCPVALQCGRFDTRASANRRFNVFWLLFFTALGGELFSPRLIAERGKTWTRFNSPAVYGGASLRGFEISFSCCIVWVSF